MSKASVTVLGGDLRGRYLAEYMEHRGHEVTCFGVMPFPLSEGRSLSEDRSTSESRSLSEAISLREAVSSSDWILGPMPFTRDGKRLSSLSKLLEETITDAAPWEITLEALSDVLRPGQILVGGSIPEHFSMSCARRQVTILDLAEDESLLHANAALTAEGLLSILIARTPFSLAKRSFLILGYGHCGKEIARHLNFFSDNISVFDKNPKQTALAKFRGFIALSSVSGSHDEGSSIVPAVPGDYDVIINTIPAQVLTEQQLAQLPAHCMLFDIASAPFGFHHQTVDRIGLTLIRCPGIPGAVMPKTAGELIGSSISERMLSHGF